MNAPKVVQVPGQEVEPEILAEAIKRVGDGIRRLTASGINRRGIVALIHDRTSINKGVIEKVLDAQADLAKVYCR